MLALVVTMRPNEGRNADLEEAFAWATNAVRTNEPGNLLYQVVKSQTDPDSYLILELYRDQDALMAHRNSDHAKVMWERTQGLFADGPHIEYFDAI